MTSESAARRLFSARQRLKRANTIWAKGFTLIEVVIVAAIAGVLGAVAIPQFLNVKDRAESRAKVSEAVGIAKECATGYVESVAIASLVDPNGTDHSTCGGSTATDVDSDNFATTVSTVDCASTTIAAGITAVSINVATTGVISCGAES